MIHGLVISSYDRSAHIIWLGNWRIACVNIFLFIYEIWWMFFFFHCIFSIGWILVLWMNREIWWLIQMIIDICVHAFYFFFLLWVLESKNWRKIYAWEKIKSNRRIKLNNLFESNFKIIPRQFIFAYEKSSLFDDRLYFIARINVQTICQMILIFFLSSKFCKNVPTSHQMEFSLSIRTSNYKPSTSITNNFACEIVIKRISSCEKLISNCYRQQKELINLVNHHQDLFIGKLCVQYAYLWNYIECWTTATMNILNEHEIMLQTHTDTHTQTL